MSRVSEIQVKKLAQQRTIDRISRAANLGNTYSQVLTSNKQPEDGDFITKMSLRSINRSVFANYEGKEDQRQNHEDFLRALTDHWQHGRLASDSLEVQSILFCLEEDEIEALRSDYEEKYYKRMKQLVRDVSEAFEKKLSTTPMQDSDREQTRASFKRLRDFYKKHESNNHRLSNWLLQAGVSQIHIDSILDFNSRTTEFNNLLTLRRKADDLKIVETFKDWLAQETINAAEELDADSVFEDRIETAVSALRM